jgi:hypothetical protein
VATGGEPGCANNSQTAVSHSTRVTVFKSRFPSQREAPQRIQLYAPLPWLSFCMGVKLGLRH